MVRKRLIVIVALFPCASLGTAAGQHLDALIWSTAKGSGAIEVEYDFGGKVPVVDSLGFCPRGTCRYVSTDPGFRTPIEDQPPRFALNQGVPVALEIVALDAGVSVKIGSSILNAPGTRAMLGTAPSLHVHPEWQLVIPEGERGDYEVSFRLTSGTASYDPSRAYSLTLTNATGATPATTATPTPTITPSLGAAVIVGNATGLPGTQVTFEVRLRTGGGLIAGLQNDITYDPNFGMISPQGNGRPDCTVNPGIHKGQTSFAYLPPGCTPGTDCAGIRAILLSVENVAPIADGSVLYTCRFVIAPTATGTSVLVNGNAGASDPDGKTVQIAAVNGSISVPPSCAGDCGGDGQVTIDELITMVNIALGSVPVSSCSVGDTSGDGDITIDEIIQAVNRALNGC